MRMTDEQRKLAEDNHNLIYGFLNKRKLDVDDYYDIAAIGLCRAAISYDKLKEKFSTYAYRCINNEVYTYHTYLNRKKSIPEDIIYSYNITANENTKELIIDTVFQCSNNDINYILENVVFEKFLTTLKDKERLIVKHLKNELTQQEIARKLNISQQAISLNIKNIRKKWTEFNNR